MSQKCSHMFAVITLYCKKYRQDTQKNDNAKSKGNLKEMVSEAGLEPAQS